MLQTNVSRQNNSSKSSKKLIRHQSSNNAVSILSMFNFGPSSQMMDQHYIKFRTMLHINWRQLEIDIFLTVCISNGRNSIALCLQTSTNIRVVELGLYTRQTDRQTDRQIHRQTNCLFMSHLSYNNGIHS